MKNMLFCPQLSPQNTENRIIGLWNFKIFVGKQVPKHLPPPLKKGTNSPLWYSQLLYLNVLDTAMFIETPELKCKILLGVL